eukprot:scpid81757/ scgid17996/ 
MLISASYKEQSTENFSPNSSSPNSESLNSCSLKRSAPKSGSPKSGSTECGMPQRDSPDTGKSECSSIKAKPKYNHSQIFRTSTPPIRSRTPKIGSPKFKQGWGRLTRDRDALPCDQHRQRDVQQAAAQRRERKARQREVQDLEVRSMQKNGHPPILILSPTNKDIALNGTE